MATVSELLDSFEQARERADRVGPAVTGAVSSAAARIRATGVKVQVEQTGSGARVVFADNPRSRAQQRLDPRVVAERAEPRLAEAAEQAVEAVMGA